MRKNLNSFHVEGYLYDVRLDKKVTGPTSKNPGTPFIMGELDIAVDEAGMNVIPIHFTYVTEKYGSGKDNRNFPVLAKLATENGVKGADAEKTWLASGKENALKLKIDGNLGLNDFISSDGQRVSARRCDGSFVNVTATLGDENTRNTFQADMVINRVNHVDADPEKNIAEDFTTVGGAIFNFRNDLLPVELTVRNAGGMKYFEDLDASPKSPIYTKVWGRINSQTIKVDRVEESAFGEASVTSSERKNREWMITGTAKVPYDFGDEEVMTEAELTTAAQNREVLWAEIKKRNDEYLASRGTPKAAPAANTAAAAVQTGGFSF